MSGVEIVGTISAVISILQAAAEVADRISQARDKDAWTSLITQNRKELRSLGKILEMIKEEKALRTKGVIGEVIEISDLATKVETLLKTMEESGFRSNFKNGKKWKAELQALTSNIQNAKGTLTLAIGSANVGLIMLTDNKYAVQVEKINNVESQLKKLVDNFECLDISDVLRGRKPRGDGTVPLEDDDLEALGLRGDEDGPYQDGSRIIDNNLTLEQAMMINGTVGTEGFIEPKHVEILNNVARHQSVMVNTSVSVDEADKNRDHHLKIIEALAKGGAFAQGQNTQSSRPHHSERVRSGRVERTQGL